MSKNESMNKDANETEQLGGKNFIVSIEDFSPEEENILINSPRSLEACRVEGIDPSELLFKYFWYRPVSYYQKPGKGEGVAQLRFETYEAKRKELIEIIKNRRNLQMQEEEKKAEKSKMIEARFFNIVEHIIILKLSLIIYHKIDQQPNYLMMKLSRKQNSEKLFY